VGLLDVDVYGPSLPVLVKPDDPAVRKSPKGSGMVYPIEHKGVKMLSLGFVSPSVRRSDLCFCFRFVAIHYLFFTFVPKCINADLRLLSLEWRSWKRRKWRCGCDAWSHGGEGCCSATERY
jgi:hypothetical protein